MEIISKIYKITNLINKYVYVGSTNKEIEERFKEHMKPSNIEKSPNSNFYKDVIEFGKENFTIELLDTCFERHRFIIEEYWWNKLYDEDYLMYDIKKGNSHQKNTKQRIANVRAKNDNVYKSEEFKVKLSEKTSGENNGMFGRKNEEAVNGRMVVAYKDKEMKNIEHIFPSVKVTMKFLGIKGHLGLNKACKEKTLYHGYYWSKEWIDR